MDRLTDSGRKRQNEIVQMLKDTFRSHQQNLQDVTIILFGSRANGTAQERSDFDIGIIHNGTLNIRLKYDLIDWLEAIPTLMKFDVVDLEAVPDDFRKEALKNHQVLFE